MELCLLCFTDYSLNLFFIIGCCTLHRCKACAICSTYCVSIVGDVLSLCGDRSAVVTNRVTTCLENLEMSGNLTAVMEMSLILLNVRGKCCLKLFIVSCIFAYRQVFSTSTDMV